MSKQANFICILGCIATVILTPATFSDIISDLRVHLSFDAGDMTDSSGNGLDGFTQGTPGFVMDAIRGPVLRVGDFDYGEIAENAATPVHPIGSEVRTYSIWAQMNSYVNDAGVWHSGGVGSNQADFSVEQLSTAGQLTSNGWNADFNFGVPGDVNAWHHIAVTYDGSTVIAYVDGMEEGRLNATLATHNNPILIGGPRFNSNRVGADASLDDFRIYARALNPGEVQDLYNTTRIPEPSTFGLLGFGLVGLLAVRRNRK